MGTKHRAEDYTLGNVTWSIGTIPKRACDITLTRLRPGGARAPGGYCAARVILTSRRFPL